jgi:hypothetical protein
VNYLELGKEQIFDLTNLLRKNEEIFLHGGVSKGSGRPGAGSSRL